MVEAVVREYLFRGQKDGVWYYGDLVKQSDGYYIVQPEKDFIGPVENVGQYLELQDDAGEKLFQGDIIFAKDWNPGYFEIRYAEGGYYMWYNEDCYPTDINFMWDSTGCHCHKVGNVFDMPNWREKNGI